MRHCYAALSVELPICVAVRYPTLRICGYMARKARPAEEKILCRSPIVSALQISPCYPKGKRGDSQEGGKPQVVYPLVRPRGVSAVPFASQAANPNTGNSHPRFTI